MSVLIKTMMMPDSCHVCLAGFGGYCFVAPAETDGVCPDHGRADWCPIIEVPDHGDLIDRDSLKADLGITDWECKKCQWGGLFGCKRDDFSDACFFLENAEVIIPAERSEE